MRDMPHICVIFNVLQSHGSYVDYNVVLRYTSLRHITHRNESCPHTWVIFHVSQSLADTPKEDRWCTSSLWVVSHLEMSHVHTYEPCRTYLSVVADVPNKGWGCERSLWSISRIQMSHVRTYASCPRYLRVMADTPNTGKYWSTCDSSIHRQVMIQVLEWSDDSSTWVEWWFKYLSEVMIQVLEWSDDSSTWVLACIGRIGKRHSSIHISVTHVPHVNQSCLHVWVMPYVWISRVGWLRLVG